MHQKSNLVHVIAVFFMVAKTVNGFINLAPFVIRRSALQNPKVTKGQHSLASVVSVNATRRRRVDETTTSKATANPRLHGSRQRTVGQKNRMWMENYEALLEFKQLNQHCRVPQRYCSPDRALGSWVSVLRMNGREKVSLEQLELLNKAGFNWESRDERFNRLWQESYQKLIEYNELYGD